MIQIDLRVLPIKLQDKIEKMKVGERGEQLEMSVRQRATETQRERERKVEG